MKGLRWDMFTVSSLLEEESPGFVRGWYLARNPDVAAAVARGEMTALGHFEDYGWTELRDPGPLFDTSFYLGRYGDVEAEGVNPLGHYLIYGHSEGRVATPFFDESYYLGRYGDVSQAVADGEFTAYEHFLKHGFDEGRNPFQLLDEDYYLGHNGDVATSDYSPFQHYVQFGQFENRAPSASFQPYDYAAVMREQGLKLGDNPDFIQHYLTVGAGLGLPVMSEILAGDGTSEPTPLRLLSDISDQAQLANSAYTLDIARYMQGAVNVTLDEAIIYGAGNPELWQTASWLSINSNNNTLSGTPTTNQTVMVQLTITGDGTPITQRFELFVHPGLDYTGTDAADSGTLGAGLDVIWAAGGDDTLDTQTGADLVHAGNGNDTISSWNGNDTIWGGEGNDLLDGSFNYDLIYGGDGGDSITGVYFDDTLYGGQGNDTLRGGNDNDRLYGQTGNDSIKGEKDNDTLIGGSGSDTLTGGTEIGTNNDFFTYLSLSDSTTTETDIITDFTQGSDKIDLSALNFTSISDLAITHDGTHTTIADSGTFRIRLNNFIAAMTNADFTFGVEDQVADAGAAYSYTPPPGMFEGINNGIITYSATKSDGSALPGWLNVSATTGAFSGTPNAGGADNDYLAIKLTANNGTTSQTERFDLLVTTAGYTAGTAGNDSATGTGGADTIVAGLGDDTVNGDSGNDTMFGGEGADSLHGGGNDEDIIYGGDGNDTIIGGDGRNTSDTMYGGKGNDVFYFFHVRNSQSDPDVIVDFMKGEDKIHMDGMLFNNVQAGAAIGITLGYTYDAGNDRTVLSGNLGYEGTMTIYLKGNIALDNSDFIYTNITQAGSNLVIQGTSNQEGIIGTDGADTIYGNGGNHDLLSSVTDNIWGGLGNDLVINANVSDDIFVWAWDGDDTIIGNLSWGIGGNGNDTFIFTGGYGINGDDGNDILYASAVVGSSTNFGSGNDIAYAGRGADGGLRGGDNNDYLDGGEGDDRKITGDNGNDTLRGGYGAEIDNFSGGTNASNSAGMDTFLYYDPLESSTTETDIISAFTPGTGVNSDKIVLHGFTGIAAGAAAGTVLGYVFDGTHTVISSIATYNFQLKLLGNYTGGGTPFDIPNDFQFNAGILGTNGADGTGAFAATGGGEFIFGLEGNDTIDAGAGNDSVFGGHDADSLAGGLGDDSISGGYANDTLIGGAGADTLEGGSGNDRFVFGAGDSTAASTDVIWDFKHGNDVDIIDLSALGLTGFSDLTITYGGSIFTEITTAGGLQINLLGYYESGTDLTAADFVF